MSRVSSPRCALLAALLVCAAACHPRPGPYGSVFTRVTAPHFVVYSDVSPQAAEAHAQKLEWLLQGLLENGWEHHGELPLKLNVALLRDPADVREFTGFEFAGYFQNEVLFEPWALLTAPLLNDQLPTLVHELSHHLAYLALQNQPVWFSEGLAVYYESARIEGDDTFVLGTPQRGHVTVLAREGILPAAQLFNPELQRTQRAYASAWLLVHYLMTRRPDSFVRYQDLLAQGKDHEAAWEGAFPDLPQEKLDAVLRDYFLLGSYEVLEARFQPAPVSTQSSPLTRADEDALFALLWHTCWQCGAEERERKMSAHIQRALARDPRHVEARLLIASTTDSEGERKALFEALTRDAPQDYRGWLGLALLQRGAEARTAVDRAIELAPRQPRAWLARAQYEWNSGDRAAALRSAERALRLQATNLSALTLYAEMLFHDGRCRAMDEVILRAFSVERAELDAATSARLRSLSKTCAGGGSAGTP